MRAILLAAGMGTRLRPLTENTPKSLIEIGGEPLAERQIKYLNDIGIKDIYIVTGYLSEKFEYLREKYGVTLINNEFYDKYNNIYSMYLAKDYLGDSYVIDADVYLSHNFLKNNLKFSSYFSGKKNTLLEEWKLESDLEGRVYNIKEEAGENYIMSGVSYWTKKDAEIILRDLHEIVKDIENPEYKNLYWDNIVRNNLSKLEIKIEKISGEAWYEVDNLEDYIELKTKKEDDNKLGL